jgi:D-tyrosyl-tRNA(Tyr) deacylase
MKALIQRVNGASVSIENNLAGQIGRGIVVFIGVERDDSEKDARYLADKIKGLRIFPHGQSEFDISVSEIDGEILIISQFTLLANLRKGRRPSFADAAPPDKAQLLYDFFVNQIRSTGLKTETGVFQEHMLVHIDNDGPFTLWMDSRK